MTKQNRRKLLYLIMAYAAVLSLSAIVGVIGGLESDSGLVNVLSRVPNSFVPDSLSDILLFGAVYFLLLRVCGREEGPDIWTVVLAVILSVLYYIAMALLWSDKLSFFHADLYQAAYALLCIFGLFCVLYPVLRLCETWLETGSGDPGAPIAHPMRTAFLCILLGMLPWLLLNYPGTFCPDSSGQIQQFLGLIPWSAHHPPLTTAIMGLCFSVGSRVWDANFGCFLFELFQSVCGALIFAFGLSELSRHTSRRTYVLLLLFTALSPLWGCSAQAYEKDFLYAEFFALTFIFMLRLVLDGDGSRRNILFLTLSGTIAVLLRKTGLYELLPAFILLALLQKKGERLRLLASSGVVLAVWLLVNNVLYPSLGIEPGSVKEALSIPFQQTARYVNTYPDEITEREREVIDSVLDYSRLDRYNPEVSDNIKATYRGDASKLPAYFRVWFEMLRKHPITYIEAFFKQCFGYLAPVRSQLDCVVEPVTYPELLGIGLHSVTGEGARMCLLLVRLFFTDLPIVTVLSMAGTYTWVAMFCFVQLIRKKSFRELVLFVPVIMNILVCIASPLCAATRYELPTIAIAPFLLTVTMICSRRAENAPPHALDRP